MLYEVITRSLSIPARLVVGYLYGLEPMDLHAWFEAYVAVITSYSIHYTKLYELAAF